jgi:hypothetical protein
MSFGTVNCSIDWLIIWSSQSSSLQNLTEEPEEFFLGSCSNVYFGEIIEFYDI